MKSYAWLFVFVMLFQGMAACAPRVRVRANPQPHDTGIRYYRPKPYLLVTSVSQTVLNESGKPVREVVDDRFVQIELQYLPDFSEEYSIDVRSGFGIADVSLTLEDGWNLTAINQKLDSQTDENVRAMAEVVRGAAGLTNPGGRTSDPDANKTPAFRVKASNVPLGYYESVIDVDGCGKKRLYGFRYIGFFPYQGCPVNMHGCEVGNCQSTEIYGLVFENGVMVFRPIHQIQMRVDPSERLERTTEIPMQGLQR
ncbi:MAG: hypothetical protein ACK6DC_21650 [Planctomycetota bacterium]